MRERFFEQIASLSSSGSPPKTWQPALCGDLDCTIKSDGEWWMQGLPIRRSSLVQLYASVLRREDLAYFLVTPVEKWRIVVEDLPFVIVGIHQTADGDIECRTNLGETVVANASHPISLIERPAVSEAQHGQLLPAIEIRSGLQARFNRSSYYELAALAVENGQGEWAVESDGETFIIG